MNKGRLKQIISIIKKNNLINDRSPENLRKTLEDLGPTFIKMGQILSTRVDSLSEEYVEELSKLRKNVKELDFKTIESILFEGYGNYKSVFSYVEERPIGSASIAQVHRARLLNGDEVVLKIKRPGVDEEVKEDFELLKEVIKTLHLKNVFKVMDLDLLIDEVYKSTLDELNFGLELKNIIEFSNNNYGVSTICVPYVIDSLSKDNILVMEYIDGININEVDKLKQEGYKPKTIAKELSSNYIKQALEDGLFHADPHPDNILIRNDSIVFIDWGMVGRLSSKSKELLDKCIEYIVMEDYVSVSKVLVNMSRVVGELDKNNLVNDVEAILSKYANLGLDNIVVTEFAKEAFKLLRDNNLVLNNDITMLVRGICIIESVIKKLDPSTSLMSVLENRIIVKKGFSKDIKKVTKKVAQTTNSLANIPVELDSFIKKVNDKDFKFKFELSDSKKHVDKLENLVHEIVLGFIDGCLIVAFSIVDIPEMKLVFFVAIVFISCILGIKMLIDLIHHGY